MLDEAAENLKLDSRLVGSFITMGKVHRHASYTQETHFDTYFYKFLGSIDYPPILSHQYASANIGAEIPSVAKYNKPQMPFSNLHVYDVAYKFLTLHFGIGCMYGSEDISVDLAIREMDKTTSPGYPWSLRFHNKTTFLENGGVDILNTFVTSLDSGTAWTPVWTSSVKAELRAFDKFHENNLRTFCAGPIEHSVGLSTLCHDMNEKFYASGASHLTWSMVGFTKFYLGWNKMVKRLLLNNRKRGLALDFSQYDSSLGNAVFLALLKFRKQCLKSHPHLHARLERLYMDIIYSVMVLSDGTLVMKNTGNPSGSGNTTPDNTLAQYLLTVYCILAQWMKKHDSLPSYDDFHNTVSMSMYGDDQLFFATDEFWDWFDVQEYASDMKSVGLTVAPPDGIWDTRPIEQLTFLSQHTTKINGIYLPYPDTEKVLSSLMVGTKHNDIRFSFYRANALYEESFWNPTCRRVLGAYREYVIQQPKLHLIDTQIIPGLSWNQVKASYRTDEEIHALWLGKYEVGVKTSINGEHAL